MLSSTGARVYTAHRGRLGMVTGISAASTGGVLVKNDSSIDTATTQAPQSYQLQYNISTY